MTDKIKKTRVDLLLLEKGCCASREEAKKLILAGLVRTTPDHVVRKASEAYPEDTEFIIEKPLEYVSRGAFKLKDALEKHLPGLNGLEALDIGASTGGFTDLMLQKGVEKVYAVDSGYGQLHEKLRKDPRVVCLEKVNARYLDKDFLPEKVDLLTMDVSFISVTKILPAADLLLKEDGMAFILVKPQFESERHEVGKGGVVKEVRIIEKCIEKVSAFAEGLQWRRLGVYASPIKGPKGNQEYMLVFQKGG